MVHDILTKMTRLTALTPKICIFYSLLLVFTLAGVVLAVFVFGLRLTAIEGSVNMS